MIEGCARAGFGELPLRDLVALAGISKTTFYEHFESKEECFESTFDASLEVAVERAHAGAGRHGTKGEARLIGAMSGVFEGIVDQPAAARIIFVESFALGAAGHEMRERACGAFEHFLEITLGDGGNPRPDFARRAIVGGLWRIISLRLREGRPELLRDDIPALADWVLECHHKIGIEPEPAPPRSSPRRLNPPGAEDEPLWDEPPDSPRARKVLTQRQRILRAVALVASTQGYGGLTVTAITSRAGISNQTFYAEFSGKHEAFLASFDALADRGLALAGAAFSDSAAWEESIRDSIGAVLEYLSRQPLFARLAFFELPAAGPAALDHSERAIDAFLALLRPPALPAHLTPQPAVVIDAVGGSLWSLIGRRIGEGGAVAIEELGPDLARIALSPFE
jgi:AcrR family transcriptional regulator